MEINRKNIEDAYAIATDSEKKMLSTLFPDLSLGQTEKAPDNRPVTERIKTLEDACTELGDIHCFVTALRIAETNGAFGSDIIAYLKLRIICAALNEGWEPQFTENELRWFPGHYLWTESELSGMSDVWKAERHLIMIGDKYQSEYAGLACAYSNNAPSYSNTNVGSRLCLKSERLATYCGQQFIDIWADFYLPRVINKWEGFMPKIKL